MKRVYAHCLAIFYALKRKSKLVFWGPGPEKREKAPQSRLFAPKRTFGPEVAFLRKSAFRGQKSIFGDSGGISLNLSKELLLFRAFSGFGRFRDAKIQFLWKRLRFTWFSSKSDFMSFYNFSRRVMKNVLLKWVPSIFMKWVKLGGIRTFQSQTALLAAGAPKIPKERWI